MRAFVVGISGLVGEALARQLCEDSRVTEVRAFARRSLIWEHPKLNLKIIDFEDLLSHSEFLEGDHIFCCLGTTMRKAKTEAAFQKIEKDYVLRLARMAAMKGIKGFTYVSSRGAKLESPFFYFRVKAEIEAELSRTPFQILRIYQPGILLGKRKEFRPLEKLIELFFKLPLGFQSRATPVSSLVASMMDEAFDPEAFGKKVISTFLQNPS